MALKTGLLVAFVIRGSVLMGVMAGKTGESIPAFEEAATLHQAIRGKTLGHFHIRWREVFLGTMAVSAEFVQLLRFE